MFSKSMTVFALCLMLLQTRAASDDDMMDDIDTLPERSEFQTSDVGMQMEVYTQLEEVWANLNKASQLFCNYTVSTGEDVPVTVTWRVGDSPGFSIEKEIIKCYGYTHANNRCDRVEVIHPDYRGRVRIAQDTPSLEITDVIDNDNRNYWCLVEIENNANPELGFDMKSVVLRITNGPNTPKFHSVEIDEDITASDGNEVTINCNCINGYHCEDVYWYKGPEDTSYSNYDLVYARITYAKPKPTEYHGFNQWADRTYLSGDSLVMTNVTMADSGRYWCELRSSAFYAIGEYATDAKSVVLTVTSHESRNAKPFECLDNYGLYPDPLECTMYHECLNGEHYYRDCASGTVFNPDSLRCDFSTNVAPPCGSKTTV